MNEPLTPEQAAAQTFFESCPFKAISSGVVGFGMGGLFGMFMGSIDFTSSSELVSRPLREQVVKGYKEMFQRAFSSAKGFGMVASIYSGTECLIESYRAKTDIYNSVSAGCITGGVLARKSGPLAAAGGCASFAAFSAAIDYYLKERGD